MALRNWSVNHRGKLADHASLTVDEGACFKNGIDPKTVSTGAIAGVVDVVEIVKLDEERFIASNQEHLASSFFAFSEPMNDWKLAHAQLLEQAVVFR